MTADSGDPGREMNAAPEPTSPAEAIWICCRSRAAAALCPTATSTRRRPRRGEPRARTGSLTGTNSFVRDRHQREWTVLTFAFISSSAGPTGRTAIDALSPFCGRAGAAHEPGHQVHAHRRPRHRLAVRPPSAPAGQARPRGHRLHPQAGHRLADGGLAQRRATGARGDRVNEGGEISKAHVVDRVDRSTPQRNPSSHHRRLRWL